MTTIPVASIVVDAGTQIRAALNNEVVTEYAERMTEGVMFPPVVLFHDGNHYYLADGFHRVMAATRNQFRDIASDVRPGSKQDALWFALGANKANGQRLTRADKKHAVIVAFQAWPDKSQREIAAQIGCSKTLVQNTRAQVVTSDHLADRTTGKDGKIYPASRPSSDPKRHPKGDEIEARLRAGEPVESIARALHVGPVVIARLRKAAGLEWMSKSKNAVQQRSERVREMAAAGFSTRQIAAEIGLGEQRVAEIAKAEAIDILADRVIGKTRRHDSTRIIEQTVMDAEHLTTAVGLIEFSTLDRLSIPRWIDALVTSRKSLDAFIRRLKQEQQKHGEAA